MARVATISLPSQSPGVSAFAAWLFDLASSGLLFFAAFSVTPFEAMRREAC